MQTRASIVRLPVFEKISLDPGTDSNLYTARVTERDSIKPGLRVGELARLTGVSTDTLRHYERIGLLSPRRARNGYREYPAQAVRRVQLIQNALNLGFSLAELAHIFKVREGGGAPCQKVRALAAHKLSELETLITQLCAARDEMRALLQEWDQRLTDSATGPAHLLESLSDTSFANSEKQGLLAARGLRPISKQRRGKK
jgi:MerR family transcriptional regulator, Zn(II)-responsive regulator of zntA